MAKRQKLSPEARAEYERMRNQRIAQLAQKGGDAVAAKYGKKYMSYLGKRGFEAMCRELQLTPAQGVAFLNAKKAMHKRQPVGQLKMAQFAMDREWLRRLNEGGA